MSSKKQKVASSSDADRNQKACSNLLKAMLRNPNCGPFLEPVDWKALELPMYPKLIKKPMDLGTIEKKLQSNKYAAVEDFANDVRLFRLRSLPFHHLSCCPCRAASAAVLLPPPRCCLLPAHHVTAATRSLLLLAASCCSVPHRRFRG